MIASLIDTGRAGKAKNRRSSFGPLLGLLLLLASSTLTAQGKDTLILKDGRLIDGVSIEPDGESLTVSFPNGNVLVPRSQVHEYILAKGEDFEPTTDAERKQLADGKVRYKGKWMTAGSRAKKLAKDLEAKREEIEERKVGRLWRNREIVETKNFIFESTAPKHITAYYRELAEAYFQEFAKTWRIKRGSAGKLTVKFFVDNDNYLQVTGVSASTLGFFRFIEPYELCIYYDRLDPAATEEVLFHELGHYLQKLIDVDFRYPHFPGESLSEYYGASSWDPKKKKVTVGKVLASRLQEVLYDKAAGTEVTIKELLEGSSKNNYRDYTWGWTLVHYLMSNKKYAKNFTKFYVGLAKAKNIDRHPLNYGKTTLKSVDGESMSEAFHKYMKIKSEEDLLELQEEWYDHIENELKLDSARGLETAAFTNLRQGRRIRAQRLFEEAIEKGTENSLTYFRYGGLLASEGKREEAHKNYELAIEMDGLVPQYYISLGSSLLRVGTQESYDAGENMLRLALDIEPENFYLERNMKRLLTEGKRRLKQSKPKTKKKS